MYKHVINNLIPADDLHWCEEEGKYISLSKEEMDDVIATCLAQGIKDLDDVMKVINWCGTVRVGEILWRNFLGGSVRISGFDEHGEPRFIPRKETGNED